VKFHNNELKLDNSERMELAKCEIILTILSHRSFHTHIRDAVTYQSNQALVSGSPTSGNRLGRQGLRGMVGE